jgi:hypothetical protein
MCSFIESNTVIAYEYSIWLNKRIYGSKNKPKDPLWVKNWEKLFEDSYERWLFSSFVGTRAGQKWLTTEFGRLYLKWQEES